MGQHPASNTVGEVELCPSVEPFLTAAGDLYLLPTPALPQKVVRAPYGHWLWHALDGARVSACKLGDSCSAGADHDLVTLESTIAWLIGAGYLRPRRARAVDPNLRAFARQMRYFQQCGLDPVHAQNSIRTVRALVLGVGGGGSAVCEALARIGVGTLVCVDHDVVSAENIPRHSLFDNNDLGAPKAVAAARRARAICPSIDATALTTRIASAAQVVSLIGEHGAHMVFACADTPPLSIKRWIDEAAFEMATPVIMGGQRMPSCYVGPLIWPGRTPCFRCFGGHRYGLECGKQDPLLVELDAWRDLGLFEAPAVGFADQVVASLMVSEGVAALIGVRNPATLGRELVFDMHTLSCSWIEPVQLACERCTVGGVESRSRRAA